MPTFICVRFCLGFAVAMLASPVSAADQLCHLTGPTQFIDAMETCVSSSNLGQGPDELFNGGMWCAAPSDGGVGESITVTIQPAKKFSQIVVATPSRHRGVDGGPTAPNKVRLQTSDGIDIVADLPPGQLEHRIRLPRPALATSVKLTILGITTDQHRRFGCLTAFGPDLEDEEDAKNPPLCRCCSGTSPRPRSVPKCSSLPGRGPA